MPIAKMPFPGGSHGGEVGAAQLPRFVIAQIRICVQSSTERCIMNMTLSFACCRSPNVPSRAHRAKMFRVCCRSGGSGPSRHSLRAILTWQNPAKLLPFATSCQIHGVNQVATGNQVSRILDSCLVGRWQAAVACPAAAESLFASLRSRPIGYRPSYRVSHMHRSISTLRMSHIILVILVGGSFDMVSIPLDTSLNPNNLLVESGHQC
jgi:hypothetical protein